LKEPAMITNRTTPTLTIVNRLFTVDDSFTPSASATEMSRIIPFLKQKSHFLGIF
jgi:hypothetical protein